MKKENLNSAPWTEKEKAELARLWLMQIPVRIIAEQLQRSPSAVVSGAWRLQLPRQDEVKLASTSASILPQMPKIFLFPRQT